MQSTHYIVISLAGVCPAVIRTYNRAHTPLCVMTHDNTLDYCHRSSYSLQHHLHNSNIGAICAMALLLMSCQSKFSMLQTVKMPRRLHWTVCSVLYLPWMQQDRIFQECQRANIYSNGALRHYGFRVYSFETLGGNNSVDTEREPIQTTKECSPSLLAAALNFSVVGCVITPQLQCLCL